MLDWCTELRNTLKQDKQNGAAMLVPDVEDPHVEGAKDLASKFSVHFSIGWHERDAHANSSLYS